MINPSQPQYQQVPMQQMGYNNQFQQMAPPPPPNPLQIIGASNNIAINQQLPCCLPACCCKCFYPTAFSVVSSVDQLHIKDSFKSLDPKSSPLGPLSQFTSMIGNHIENDNCFCIWCCRSCRSFETTMKIQSVDISTSKAPMRCHCLGCFRCGPCNFCSFPCCRPTVDVFMNQQLIGRIRVPFYCPIMGQKCCDMLELIIQDELGNEIFWISNPLCQKQCIGSCIISPCLAVCYCPELNYNIYAGKGLSGDGSMGNNISVAKDVPIGQINWIWDGCCSNDQFGIHFPPFIDVKKKVLLMQAAFEIDFLRHEF